MSEFVRDIETEDRCSVCGSAEVTLLASANGGVGVAYCDEHGPEWMGFGVDDE